MQVITIDDCAGVVLEGVCLGDVLPDGTLSGACYIKRMYTVAGYQRIISVKLDAACNRPLHIVK